MTPFVILTMFRSGSQYLVRLLDSHPQVWCREEPWGYGTECFDLDHLMAASFPAGRKEKAQGFKVLQDHVGPRPFLFQRLMEVPGLRVIVLERRNQLARIRSEMQARARYDWTVDSKPDVEPPAVHLDPFQVHSWLYTATAWHRTLQELPCPKAWVYYEDLCENPVDTLAPVWTTLGVPTIRDLSLARPSRRQESRGLAETVTNLDELETFLSRTPYHSLIKEWT